ncbi:MAG TPA: phosphonate ABC transporter ATP-binding protein [Firmicutes bacterium]|nr:phosphonate ABC transporter ATP-binding protein [Bacillota bacterium]
METVAANPKTSVKQLEIRRLVKVYPDGTRALENADLDINYGELIAVVGLSGAGKSTLLRCINRLVEPTSGSIAYYQKNGEAPLDVVRLRGSALSRYRSKVGMIFQHFNLVPRLSVLLNVLAGRLSHVGTLQSMAHRFPDDDIDRALAALKRVGIVEKAYQRAGELSGGQMQRVGIARALVQEPEILLADEPVASLDPATSADILNYLRAICIEDGLTLLINLHSVELVRKFCRRAVGFRAGRKVFDGVSDSLDKARYKEIYGVEEG